MADSFSCSNCADTEDSESNLSLSVGYYPNEDTFSDENTTSYEDTSSNNLSTHFVPPERQDQIQDSTEQFGKLGITLAWNGSNHSPSVLNWDLHGDNQWIDKYPKEKTKLTLSKLNGLVQRLEQFLENQEDDKDDESVFPESAQKEDFQLFRSTPPDVTQVSHQEHDICLQDLPTFDPPENDATQCPQVPPKCQEHEFAEVSTVMPQRWVFRWLRQRVFPFWGREHPKKAPKNSHKLTRRNRFSHRSKKIQPQESIDGEYPILPDFKTF